MAIPICIYSLLNHDIFPMLMSYISLYISTPFGAVPLIGAYYLLYTTRNRTVRRSRRPNPAMCSRPRPLRAIRPHSVSTRRQYPAWVRDCHRTRSYHVRFPQGSPQGTRDEKDAQPIQ